MSSIGGGAGFSNVQTPVVSFEANSISISGAGAEATPEIPIDADGCVDLNALTSVLSEQTGIPEDKIVKEFLPGIVKQIEAHGAYKLKGLELLKDMASDRMDTARPTVSNGPQNVTSGMDDSTKQVVLVFTQAGVYVNPNNAQNNEALTNNIKSDLSKAINSSGPAIQREHVSDDFSHKLSNYMQQFPYGDVMSSLFYVFQESIKQTNEDKAYFLHKLSDMNKISEAQSA